MHDLVLASQCCAAVLPCNAYAAFCCGASLWSVGSGTMHLGSTAALGPDMLPTSDNLDSNRRPSEQLADAHCTPQSPPATECSDKKELAGTRFLG